YTSLLKKPEPDRVADLTNQSLVLHCIDNQTRYILVTSLCPVTMFTLELLRKAGIKRIHWFYEDYTRAGYWKQVVQGYDLFAGIQRGYLEKTILETGCRYIYLPVAGDRDAPEWNPDKAEKDISFVGLPTRYRIEFLEECRKAGLSIAIGGLGWDRYQGILRDSVVHGKWLDRSGYLKITSMGKTGLNLSFKNPSETRDDTHLTPRIYDILSMGMPLFTENVPLLRETLPDFHYETFTCSSVCIQKIRDFINQNIHSRISERLRTNREGILQNEVWKNRIETIISEGASLV
ncbi:MAG: glycosyltransferase family protein, partial [Chitinivibrionales bacterium]